MTGMNIIDREPWWLYERLLAQAQAYELPRFALDNLLLGINWSVATLSGCSQPGLCFSPTQVGRTLPWAGSLQDYDVEQLLSWLSHWEPAEAVIGGCVLNSVINSHSDLVTEAEPLSYQAPPHLQVFHHFRSQLREQNVVVIGRYPGLEAFPEVASWQCIERQPGAGDMPDTAAHYLLPEADWVFITASSLSNKTLPQLLQWSRQAKVVLMGPSLPWSEVWKDFGVDYLAGVWVEDAAAALTVAAQAGGTQMFAKACHYRCLQIS